MSDEPKTTGRGEQKHGNFLLNAFLPDDLVTFPVPVNNAGFGGVVPSETAVIPDATSEISLDDDDDVGNQMEVLSSQATTNLETDSFTGTNNNTNSATMEFSAGEIQEDYFDFQKDSTNNVPKTSEVSNPLMYTSHNPIVSSLDTPMIFTPTPIPAQVPPQMLTSIEKTSLPTSPVGPPTSEICPAPMSKNDSAGNTFRLSSGHKPKYAQYPGLVSQPMPPFQQQQQQPAPGFQQMALENDIFNIGNRDAPAAGGTGVQQPNYGSFDNPPTYNVMSIPTVTDSIASPTHYYDMYSTSPSPSIYKPVNHHWYFRKEGEPWKPFSYIDSKSLEEAYISSSSKLVSVDGGRQDVCLKERVRKPVYWEDTDVTHVQRCSWFYKGPNDSQYIPYSEEFSTKLEEEYEVAHRTNTWHRRLEFSGGEAVVLQSPISFVHFCKQASVDEWGSVPESQLRPRVVKRGTEGQHIPPGESVEIDYLVFLVHGIGSFCDFKFRTVVETVDDFRTISDQLLQSHFKNVTGRVEFLPVQWHKALHGDGGIDEKLKPLTLKSIPKLRHFTNDTLLDILFYTSPVYCQTIMNTVGNEMNRMYALFLERNPNFNCLSVAVGGHSLGSLILFDLLAHQPEIIPSANTKIDNSGCETSGEPDAKENALHSTESRMVSYRMGSAGTGQPFISYPTLDFQPTAFFALGSPIAMFVAVRGLDSLGEDFHLPTCPAFFNIFHPYDPVAYRMESLIDPKLDLRPVLVPHHKGRKRFHLELKETMARVGSELKNRVMESIRVTYKVVTSFAGMAEVEEEVDSAIAAEFNNHDLENNSIQGDKNTRIGCLNSGRRIDYVLQEAPHQILNEYLFALSSHVCYWESEDTVLLVLNEILNEGKTQTSTPEPGSPGGGDQTVQQPQFPQFYNNPQSTTGVIPSFPNYDNHTSPPSYNNILNPPIPLPGTVYTSGTRPLVADIGSMPLGIDPTAPVSLTNIGPPPKTGFQPKN